MNSLISRELYLRLVSGLLLGSSILAILAFGNELLFIAMLATLITLCAWEWLNFIKTDNLKSKLIWVCGFLGLLTLSNWVGYHYWLTIGVMWWSLAWVVLFLFPGKTSKFFTKPAILFNGSLILIVAFQALLFLESNRELIVLLLILIWSADTGAYFAGKKIGKTKLAPNISPGKSVEGAIGGLILACGLGTAYWWQDFSWHYLLTFAVVVVISIIGDLMISIYKRNAKIKDSGNILPGHGGILDRVDSILAAAPVFVMYFGVLA